MSYLSALATILIDLVGEQFAFHFASYEDGIYRKKSPPGETLTRAEFRSTIGFGMGGGTDQVEGIGVFMESVLAGGPCIEAAAKQMGGRLPGGLPGLGGGGLPLPPGLSGFGTKK